MHTLLKKGIVLLAVAAGIAGAWIWLDKQQDDSATEGGRRPSGPASVVVATIEAGEFSSRIESVGTVRSDESIELTANVTESVEALLFTDGQVVTNGQLLAVLSSEEEEAALQGAEIALADHRREIKRLTDLVRDGAAPEVRLQARQTLADVADQHVRESRAKLQDRRIHAPFAGVLGLRRISPGALVTPGTLITTLDKIDRVKLDFSVPETVIRQLQPGVRISARTTAYPDKGFNGEVAHVDSRVDPVTRSITVRAVFENPDHRLRPGMLMTTTLEGDPRTSPRLPERAVLSSGQRHFAFVVSPGEESAATVERRILTLGRRTVGYVEVLSGIELGERVVADGLLGLRDGSAVVVTGTFEGPVEAFQP